MDDIRDSGRATNLEDMQDETTKRSILAHNQESMDFKNTVIEQIDSKPSIKQPASQRNISVISDPYDIKFDQQKGSVRDSKYQRTDSDYGELKNMSSEINVVQS